MTRRSTVYLLGLRLTGQTSSRLPPSVRLAARLPRAQSQRQRWKAAH